MGDVFFSFLFRDGHGLPAPWPEDTLMFYFPLPFFLTWWGAVVRLLFYFLFFFFFGGGGGRCCGMLGGS